jgi:hypothetical protein
MYMGKSVLVTENQKKLLIIESFGDNFLDIVKKNYEFTKKILEESSSQIGMNLQFMVTWGASIGGFMGPINEFLQSGNVNISPLDMSLILTGIAATHFLDNSEKVNKIIKIIQEKGLMETFTRGLRKSDELKKAFFDFISSLNITLHKVTNMLSYTFIIPLLPSFYQMATNMSIDPKDIKQISLRLSSFGLLTISGIIMKELVQKIINRFNSK